MNNFPKWIILISFSMGFALGYILKAPRTVEREVYIDKQPSGREELLSREMENKKFEELSGIWQSVDKTIRCEWDFRTISFSATGEWEDLNDEVFLISEGLGFITHKRHYIISWEKNNPKRLVINGQSRSSADDRIGIELFKIQSQLDEKSSDIQK